VRSLVKARRAVNATRGFENQDLVVFDACELKAVQD